MSLIGTEESDKGIQNGPGYTSPRTTQDIDRSIWLVEVPPGIREALRTLEKISIIAGLSPFALHPHSIGNRARTSPRDTRVMGLLPALQKP